MSRVLGRKGQRKTRKKSQPNKRRENQKNYAKMRKWRKKQKKNRKIEVKGRNQISLAEIRLDKIRIIQLNLETLLGINRKLNMEKE